MFLNLDIIYNLFACKMTNISITSYLTDTYTLNSTRYKSKHIMSGSDSACERMWVPSSRKHFPFIIKNTWWCALMCAGLRGVRWSALVCVGVCWRELVCADVHWPKCCALVCAGVRWAKKFALVCAGCTGVHWSKRCALVCAGCKVWGHGNIYFNDICPWIINVNNLNRM